MVAACSPSALHQTNFSSLAGVQGIYSATATFRARASTRLKRLDHVIMSHINTSPVRLESYHLPLTVALSLYRIPVTPDPEATVKKVPYEITIPVVQ